MVPPLYERRHLLMFGELIEESQHQYEIPFLQILYDRRYWAGWFAQSVFRARFKRLYALIPKVWSTELSGSVLNNGPECE